MGLTNALRLGVTNIIVEDTRVAGHIQLSSLNVVLPDSLWLYVAPLSIFSSPMEETQPIQSMVRWHLISGHQYLIQIKAFSQGPDAHEIYITEVNFMFLWFEKFNDHIGKLLCIFVLWL